MAKQKHAEVTEIVLRVEYPSTGDNETRIKYIVIPAKGIVRLTLDGEGVKYSEYFLDPVTIGNILKLRHEDLDHLEQRWKKESPLENGAILAKKSPQDEKFARDDIRKKVLSEEMEAKTPGDRFELFCFFPIC